MAPFNRVALKGAFLLPERGTNVRCPYCRKDNDRVVDSRSSAEGRAIRRRRQCIDCKKRFTTYETLEEGAIRVVKKDGSREPFDRRKLLAGIEKACQKRPISTQLVEDVVDTIESEITQMFDREVASRFIGEQVMKHLQKLDEVAYVRFASVYRNFKDVTEYYQYIEEAKKKQDAAQANEKPAPGE
jgi:transcriptional repressor NrdR